MGIILVYDVTNMKSFQNVRGWMRQIEENASENVSVLLVGNKDDMADERVLFELTPFPLNFHLLFFSKLPQSKVGHLEMSTGSNSLKLQLS